MSKQRKLRASYIEITKDLREKLNKERTRTGVGFSVLLRGNPIEGVNSSLVSGWARGNIGTGKKQLVEQVLNLYKKLPSQGSDKLTESESRKVKDKIKQTGLSLERLLTLRDDVPQGLEAKSFYRDLLNDKIKTYNKNWGNYILKVCNEYIKKRDKHQLVKGQHFPPVELPVKGKHKHNYVTNTTGFEPIPAEALETIRQRYDVIRNMLDVIFKQKNTPKNLNQYIVKNWLYGNTQSAKPEHVQWVLDETEKILNSLVEKIP